MSLVRRWCTHASVCRQCLQAAALASGMDDSEAAAAHERAAAAEAQLAEAGHALAEAEDAARRAAQRCADAEAEKAGIQEQLRRLDAACARAYLPS